MVAVAEIYYFFFFPLPPILNGKQNNFAFHTVITPPANVNPVLSSPLNLSSFLAMVFFSLSWFLSLSLPRLFLSRREFAYGSIPTFSLDIFATFLYFPTRCCDSS
jgi:hypothetical protein